MVVGVRGPPDRLEHAVWMTEAELLLGFDCDREFPFGKAIADLAFELDGDVYAVEIDNGHKQSKKQYEAKMKNYAQAKFDGFLLVLCHTDKRMKSLVKWCEPLKKVCLFSTFTKLAAGEPWVDWFGGTVEV